ncbi:CPBP family intramembrane glutamic endopeptidase [Plantibacter sp. MMLR14_011]|uniref:CPBP family intramembrane glutamic endopeptidase n=1 Tax=Plantibacter sp. MMLR14_011 TaxID=1898746 RepID=UPI0008DE8B9A|nr:CPBP family intramembrane glutamic endopeptidase [Plantibacter sp. MMLR14_011]OII40040.1 hypothetical protein BIU99_06320 [Plantibacter sp. MMLR14_011]
MTSAPGDPGTATRVTQRFWIGLAAAVLYVLVAAGLARLLTEWFPPQNEVEDFVLGHLPVLIPLIILGVLFVRKAGWTRDVWRTPAAFETRPRRWWMLAFPVLMLVQVVALLSITPWGDRKPELVFLVLGVNILVGVGEELYFRGILRASLRAHHGETVTLVATSLLFGAGHALGSVLAGLPVAFIAIQVGGTVLMGAAFYGVFLATGRLWIVIAFHAMNDFALRISSGDLTSASASDLDPPAITGVIQVVLWVLTLVLLISCIRHDLHARREGRSTPPTVAR